MSLTAAEALDKIAKLVEPDDGGSWSDPSGKLEHVGDVIESTGREVNWEGPDYDDEEDDEDEEPSPPRAYTPGWITHPNSRCAVEASDG
ncbi:MULTISPECIES: hypothetical protein [Arthrobacter]|uniref:Uncharacterized protein n=1 Tax=Arthrobacter terricola TaxID=2547396 RepID=A0A4R5K7C9_9MICC|nr:MULTISPECIES: hypothetical protein [Arthrobacter]MBT8163080.1 hypothetical protein [Arthrobacter sp. GN70]TDF88120.1 hypothetical protein E1809_24175 [Arthrobacter terricola]